jgi:hypothetical protein
MLVVITCPTCGHLGRVPEGRIGHKVRCKGCGHTFRPDSATAQPSPEDIRKGGSKAAEADEKPPQPGVIGWLKRPTVIDAAISGALGGILSGLIIGAVTGGLHAKPKPMLQDPLTGEVLQRGSGGALAGAMGGGLLGFSIGMLGGAFLGAVLGLLAEYFHISSLTHSRRRSLFFSIAAGASVAAVIAEYPWIALGIVLGGLGGGFWSLLQNWEQAADTPFTSGFQLEEESPPQATT